jgi:hypothetical protein
MHFFLPLLCFAYHELATTSALQHTKLHWKNRPNLSKEQVAWEQNSSWHDFIACASIDHHDCGSYFRRCSLGSNFPGYTGGSNWESGVVVLWGIHSLQCRARRISRQKVIGSPDAWPTHAPWLAHLGRLILNQPFS